jgi:hypothetical protein
LIKRRKSNSKDLTKYKGVFSHEEALGLAGLVNESRSEWNQRTI